MRFVDNIPSAPKKEVPASPVLPAGTGVGEKEKTEKKLRFKFFRSIQARFNSLSKRKKIAVATGGCFLLLLFLTTLGYATYSYIKWNRDAGSPHGYRSTKDIEVKIGETKDFESPINGILYTKTQGEIFDQRRPLAIMINNHVDARPVQTGLPEADIIYEAVAEGGITRFLAVYQANDVDKLGPVRSVRVYYLDWASEFHSWVAHWGGACTPGSPANAYDYMAQNGIANLDAMWLGECSTCAYWRETNLPVAWEHNGFTATQKLYQESITRWPEWAKKVPFDRWLFKDDPPDLPDGEAGADRPSAGSFTFNFWNLPEYEVTWTYDPTENVYLRSQGGQPHKDAVTGQQLAAKNVIVQFTDERSANDGTVHLLYQTIGTGSAKVFLDGRVIDATWKKTDRELRTRYYYAGEAEQLQGALSESEGRRHFDATSGEEIKFDRGQIWVEIVPTGNEITYSSSGEVQP